MAQRTFYQKGVGYGPDTVTIDAKINGVLVYSGSVYTDPNLLAESPDTDIDLGVRIFDWTMPYVNFRGSVDFEVKVTNHAYSASYLILTETYANFIGVTHDHHSLTTRSGGPDVFGIYFVETMTDEQGEWFNSNQQISVFIDGLPQANPASRDRSGQYHWRILPQQTFQCELLIVPGIM